MTSIVDIWKQHPVLYSMVTVLCIWTLAATIVVGINAFMGA